MTEVEHNLIHEGGWQNNINNDKIDEEDLANNSAKLFERSRIKALAGKLGCSVASSSQTAVRKRPEF